MEGFEDGFEEGEEEGVVAVAVGGVGRDDAVDLEEERLRLGDEGVESLADGAASEEGLDVGNGVEDQEDQRVVELIEAVHFDLFDSGMGFDANDKSLGREGDICE